MHNAIKGKLNTPARSPSFVATAAAYLPPLWVAVVLSGCVDANEGLTPWDPPLGTGGTATPAIPSTGDMSATTGIPETGSTATPETSTGTGDPPSDYFGPARYPPGQVHSPISPFVAEALLTIAELGPSLREDIFLKTGASSTVNSNTLFCFASDNVDLGEYKDLEPTRQFFLAGDAGDGTTPFDRSSAAALSGRHAGWAIAGNPSPLQTEIELLDPRLALVHFGANDMGWAGPYIDSAYLYYENMNLVLDELEDRGIVPVLFGITRRGDSVGAQRWVSTWNTIIRGLAQRRQVLFIDMYEAIDPLDGNGLAGDGLHLEGYSGGACVLTATGLEHGYNVRNLIALQALDRAVAVLVDDSEGLDDPVDPVPGDGSAEDPWQIDTLPWADSQTTVDGVQTVDSYPGCDDTNESGPELWYRFDVASTTAIRAVVLDLDGVDIDIHLLDDSADPQGCLARSDRVIAGTLEPGTYYFVVDTWTSAANGEFPGEYMLVVSQCEADDSACAATL